MIEDPAVVQRPSETADRARGLQATAAQPSCQVDGPPTAGWRLCYLVRGAATLVMGRRREMVEAGDVVISATGMTFRLQADRHRGCLAHQIDFIGAHADHLRDGGFFSPLPAVVHAGFDEHMLGLVTEIIELARLRPAGWTRLQAGALAHLLARLEVTHRLGGATDRRVRLVQDARLLLADPARGQLALDALADELGVGYSSFRRSFSAHTGTTPHQFRLGQQLVRAQRLLHDTERSIAAIARELGFSSQAYFARLFRRKTGLSPTVWRENRTPPGTK